MRLKPSLPQKSVYFYEHGPTSTSLSVFVPKLVMSQLARRQELNSEAFTDFPYGIEVDVDEVEFEYLAKQYQIRLPVSAGDLWVAFTAFQRSNFAESATGMIDAAILNRHAKKLRPHVDAIRDELASRLNSRQEHKDVLNNEWRKSLELLFAKIPAERFDARSVNGELIWGEVRMTKGLSALEVFDAIDHPQRGRNRGNTG